jgi:Carboxypeptidase regulatory-like domain
MKRWSLACRIAVSLAAVVGACDDGNPTSPDRFQSRPVYALTGVVTEPVGVPVEDATVTVLDGPHQSKSDHTDSAGHYTLIGVDGGFSVQAFKDGYASATKPVTVSQSVELDIEITPLAVSGNISGNKKSLENARVPARVGSPSVRLRHSTHS